MMLSMAAWSGRALEVILAGINLLPGLNGISPLRGTDTGRIALNIQDLSTPSRGEKTRNANKHFHSQHYVHLSSELSYQQPKLGPFRSIRLVI